MRNSLFITALFAIVCFASCEDNGVDPVDCNFTNQERAWLAYDTLGAPIVFVDQNGNNDTLDVISKTYAEQSTEMSDPDYTRVVRTWEVVAQLDTHTMLITLQKSNRKDSHREYCELSCILNIDGHSLPVSQSFLEHPEVLDTITINAHPYPGTVHFFLNSTPQQPLDQVYFAHGAGVLELFFQDSTYYRRVP